MSLQINLIRNIINGVWAMNPDEAQSLLPLALKIISGESTNRDVIVLGGGAVASPYPEVRASYQLSGSEGQGQIGVVKIKGVLTKDDQECGPDGTETMAREIRTLADSSRISAIILDIDSPGGAVDAVFKPVEEISRARSMKPVIAYVGNGMACSAAYWIASACDEIYATYEGDIIGSIGTMMTLANWYKHLAEKEKLEVRDVYATKSTDKNGIISKALEGDDSQLLAFLDKYNDMFHGQVKNARGEKLDQSTLSGGIYIGSEAVDKGLVDGMMPFDDVVARAHELANDNPNTKPMGIFGKNKTAAELKAVTELVSTDAAQRTEEQFTAAQKELDAAGIGVVITNDPSANERLKGLIENETKIAATEQAHGALVSASEKAIATAEEYLGEESGEITSVDAAMEAVVKKATAASPTPAATTTTESPAGEEGEDMEEVLAKLPHNQTADAQI